MARRSAGLLRLGASATSPSSSGLRNRGRRGVGTYSKAGKSRRADRYGKYNGGRRIEDEKIARHVRNVDELGDDLQD